MAPALLCVIVVSYFLLLLLISWRTSKNSNNDSFFIGNKKSKWLLVSFGMIGTQLSGVTFVSVPGAVVFDSFSYFQIVIGNFIGYIIIAVVLLPLYYRLQLTSIYTYLLNRFGMYSYKTGASYFLLARTLGATARLYLVVHILQSILLSQLHFPFWLISFVLMMMIVLYTFRGGVKTIIWTDTLQTSCIILGVIICSIYLLHYLHINITQSMAGIKYYHLAHIFAYNINSSHFFLKQIVAGIFITIALNGLDQEMMQKTISVKTLRDAQKNTILSAIIFVIVVFLFLFLGGLLYLFAYKNGAQYISIPGRPLQFLFHSQNIAGDIAFPFIVLHYLPAFASVVFFIALVSALFPSADGAIVALTSSFCIDIYGIYRQPISSEKQVYVRKLTHFCFAILFFLLLLMYDWINNKSMIGVILQIAVYIYGPLLGLFALGIMTNKQIKDMWVPFVSILSPILILLINYYQYVFFHSFRFGLELIVFNGLFSFIFFYILSYKNTNIPPLTPQKKM